MTVVFALLMVTSLPAMAGVGNLDEATDDDQLDSVQLEDDRIDEAIEEADGTTEMVVRFESADVADSASTTDAIGELQQHAQATQTDAVRWAVDTDGVEFVNQFWIANAVLLEVDTTQVSPEEVLRYTGAESIHANFDVETTNEGNGTDAGTDAKSAAEPSVEPTNETVTYGLDMINATEVWDQHGTQGEGAGVAVLDTGVDTDHPDLELDDGNWQEFDDSGEPIDSEPNDGNGHGTHVSGTVVGPDDPDGDVPAYGVAPGAELYHGKVLTDDGGGSFAQVLAGMEWAIADTDADVVTMSLSAGGYENALIEPSENARETGVVLVASIGNSGQGVSGAPGNIYPNFASGAVDEDAQVASFSSGELIETDSAYPDAPEYWPDEYVVPNAAAPGVDVLSSVPGGGYDGTFSGTSMSAPHKAGAFALMVAASGGDADRELLYDAMEETAWQPAHAPNESPNTEYGHGIIDVAAATDLVALDSGVNGTVTDDDGAPIEGATVDLDDGGSATTGADGQYNLIAAEGEYTVTADAFGYESTSADVTVEAEEVTTQDFKLADGLDVELIDGQPDGVEGGDAIDVTVDAANVETVTVDLDGEYETDNATLFVDGAEAEFGEPVDLDGPVSDELTITVETTADTEGELSLEHTLTGLDDEAVLTTGPTMVFEEYVPVAVVDDDATHGDDVAATLEESLPPMYAPTVVSAEEAASGYDAIVVQHLNESNAETFIDATDDAATGVVYLDQWGAESNAIPVHANVTGEPNDTFQDDFVTPPLGYELTATHEIFDGVGDDGDTVDLHEGAFGDHTWFDGTEFDVLAETAVTGTGTTVGDGFAIDEQSATVLASNLGYTTFVGDGEYTDDADTVLANSVEYLVTDLGNGFQVDIAETNEPVIEGDDLVVNATVTNVDAENDTQTVSLTDFEGNEVDSTELSLNGSETAEVTLTWETAVGDAGTAPVTVSSDDSAASSNVTIIEEPDGLLTFGSGDHIGTIGETTTVDINTSADAVAGYGIQVHFDPDVVQVTEIEGVDFADPVTNVDNDEGTFTIAQAQAGDEPTPTFAEVEFEFINESDGASELVFDEENTSLNDQDGELDILPVNGTISTAWPGDVNADGEINAYDATLTQQYLAGTEPTDTFHESVADMNGNGQVDAGDVTLILSEIVDTHGPTALEA
ncbi:S8 family serine peptidase [Natronorubrum halophilum]|uniref:S8 family serine peptidase n=1 Tax=Natronorubrum halophilum TaxID=1702106 RepID=UPI001EE977D7|nr:S8 family serine peptidase [Natronorubrum halophilum]